MSASSEVGALPHVSKSRSSRSHLADRIAVIILIPLVLAWGMPFILMVSTSLKDQTAIYYPARLMPTPIVWSNYPDALLNFLPFGQFYLNSAVIAITVVSGSIVSSSFIAYGFARLRFPGRDILFLILLGTMMIPFAATMIPLFIMFANVGWIDTFLPLIVPSFFGTPLYVFLVRQFYRGIPDELSDAARIDGAGELEIWGYIMLPLSKPVLILVGILAVQESWNDFLKPLIFLNSPRRFTATLGLYALIPGLDAVQPWQYLMAATVTTIAPIVLLFFLGQRYFLRGISVSGLKG